MHDILNIQIEICLCTVLIILFPWRPMLLTAPLNNICSSRWEVYVNNNKQGFLSQILIFRCSSLLLRETQRAQHCASCHLWGFEESAQEPAQLNMLTNYLEGVNKMNMSLTKNTILFRIVKSKVDWRLFHDTEWQNEQTKLVKKCTWINVF